jgi:hypothetical protein
MLAASIVKVQDSYKSTVLPVTTAADFNAHVHCCWYNPPQGSILCLEFDFIRRYVFKRSNRRVGGYSKRIGCVLFDSPLQVCAVSFHHHKK